MTLTVGSGIVAISINASANCYRFDQTAISHRRRSVLYSVLPFHSGSVFYQSITGEYLMSYGCSGRRLLACLLLVLFALAPTAQTTRQPITPDPLSFIKLAAPPTANPD